MTPTLQSLSHQTREFGSSWSESPPGAFHLATMQTWLVDCCRDDALGGLQTITLTCILALYSVINLYGKSIGISRYWNSVIGIWSEAIERGSPCIPTVTCGTSYTHRCVTFPIMSNQLNSPQVDSRASFNFFFYVNTFAKIFFSKGKQKLFHFAIMWCGQNEWHFFGVRL